MELTLHIKGTEDTPEIFYNEPSNEFILSGRSLPEDVTSFYTPVFQWLSNYGSANIPATKFVFKLEYFNTASSKIILDILMSLEEMIKEKNLDLFIEWHYTDGDDDMLEAGEEYKELVEVPFKIISNC